MNILPDSFRNSSYSAHTSVLSLYVGVFILFQFGLASATTIQKLEFQNLAALSEVVFEGQVTEVEARWNGRRTRIHTYVTFTVDDLIVGNHDSNQMVLRFAGGTVEQDQQIVEALIYPKIGEHGVYFVESKSLRLINPLVGWSQGHFIVSSSEVDNELSIVNTDLQPVTQVEISLDKPEVEKTQSMEFSNGTAAGVEIGSDDDKAMTLGSFKSRILQSVEKRDSK